MYVFFFCECIVFVISKNNWFTHFIGFSTNQFPMQSGIILCLSCTHVGPKFDFKELFQLLPEKFSRISELYLDHNIIETISNSQYSTVIDTIHLDYNSIEELNGNNFKTVQNLNLSFNKISRIINLSGKFQIYLLTFH